ncbi:MAG: hypothetical protein LBI14_06905 [Treponema sp.]|nr:hypothetical protein [Treponema sp.]
MPGKHILSQYKVNIQLIDKFFNILARNLLFYYDFSGKEGFAAGKIRLVYLVMV